MTGKNQKTPEKETTSKQVLYAYMTFGIVWISACIVLAFRGSGEVALQILRAISPVITVPTGFYYATKTVENVFKYNNVFPKKDGETKNSAHIGFSDKEEK